VTFGGCAAQPFNARCEQCGQHWSADEVGRAVFSAPEDLYAYAEATSHEDLADWISDHYELDSAIMEQGVRDGVPFIDVAFLPPVNGTITATGVEFPILLEEFWEQLDERHAEAITELGSDEE
jgi:hypothetical protein